MSFETTPYEMDNGLICKMRVSDTELAAMTVSAKTVDLSCHCLNSGSRRRYGIHPRGVRLTRAVGTGDAKSIHSSFLAYPTEAGWDAVADLAKITINSVEWTVSAKLPEILV